MIKIEQIELQEIKEDIRRLKIENYELKKMIAKLENEKEKTNNP